MLQTATVATSTLELLKNLQGESLLSNTRLVGDFARIKKHIIRMTDNPDKVYSAAPLLKN